MNGRGQFGRRGFVAGALMALGGALGWTVRRFFGGPAPRKEGVTASESRFVYDVSAFEAVDPALVRYKPAQEFSAGFNRVKRFTTAPDDRIWVAGDRGAKQFDGAGQLVQELAFDRVPHCLHSTVESELLVGFGNFFEIYNSAGRRILRSARLAEDAFVTGILAHGRTVYLADAGRRQVLICDRITGGLIDEFGKRDPARNNPGFEVPSPYFDLALAPDNRLRIVNPGRLRVESYTLDGRFEFAWGEPGMQIERFSGCCNPVYFALTREGGFVTSEKGLNRIKIYDSSGTFQGVVAGPDLLVQDKQLAKRACEDCRVGAGFDVAVDSGGRVLVLDPYRKSIRAFAPNEEVHAT